MITRSTVVLSACVAACCAPTTALGDITIFLRDSSAENDVFTGAGGAIDRSDVLVSESAFTGPLMLTDAVAVETTVNDPFSTGGAIGMVDMVFMDSVTQPSPDELTISASLTATASVLYVEGAGLGSYRQDTETRVRFNVSDGLVAYCISGVWNPDPSATFITEIELSRVFNPTPIFAGSPGFISGTGVLEPGFDYQFTARNQHSALVGDNNQTASAAADYTFLIEFFPYVPCAADVEVNGDVDLDDLLLVLANFGTMTDAGDTDGNSAVELADLLTVLAEFGTSCLPCAQP